MRITRWRSGSPKKVWLRIQEPWHWGKIPKGYQRLAQYIDGDAHFEHRVGSLGVTVFGVFIGFMWIIREERS